MFIATDFNDDFYIVKDTIDGVSDKITMNEAYYYLSEGVGILGLGLFNRNIKYIKQRKSIVEYSHSNTKSINSSKAIGVMFDDIKCNYRFIIDTDKGYTDFYNTLNTDCYSSRNGYSKYERIDIKDAVSLSKNKFLISTVGFVCVKYDIECYLVGYDLYEVDVEKLKSRCLLKQNEVIYLNDVIYSGCCGDDSPVGEENLYSMINKPFGKIIKSSSKYYFNGVEVCLDNPRTYSIQKIKNGKW